MKKILFTIAAVITLAVFFTGCKGPNTPSKGGGASSQQQGGSSTPTQITITVAGDENVEFKTTTRSFKIDKNKTWADVKVEAEKLIKYKAGYENDKWKLNNKLGQDIPDNHQFNADATVYAVPKKKTITITIAGDSHTQIATVDDRNKLKRDYGVTWAEIKSIADNLITGSDENYTFSAWKLNSAEIQLTHKFTADTTVYAISNDTAYFPV